MRITVEKRPRCKSCDSDDNLRSNIQYELDLDPVMVDNRIWFWRGNTGYFTDLIFKKIDNVYISKNARYRLTDVDNPNNIINLW